MCKLRVKVFPKYKEDKPGNEFPKYNWLQLMDKKILIFLRSKFGLSQHMIAHKVYIVCV